MNSLRAMASVFAVDVFSETKLPCMVANWDYFSRLQVTMLAPVGIILVMFLVGIPWAASNRRQRRSAIVNHATKSKLRRQRMERKRGTDRSIFVAAWWQMAAAILFLVDLIYPTVTRTLLQYFTCRDVGSAGFWLEAARHSSAEHYRYHTLHLTL